MNENGIKVSAYAALALAFSSLGDAFLYPFLPVNNHLVGVPVVWIGVLLSINRFVRIFSNVLMVHFFATYGLRTVMIVAVFAAIISTAGYAFASGIIFWLAFRVLWGLSFSAMRIGTLGYSLQQSRQGFALGISRSVQESGPMVALLFAPFLLKAFDVRDIFWLLALCSIPALWFAWELPKGEDRTQPVMVTRIFKVPSTFNSITFLSAILIDGIMVVILGVLFLQHNNISLLTATSMAAFYLGYRRVCLVIFSPAGGWLADKVGVNMIFNMSIIVVMFGLVIIMSGWIAAGSIVVFTFYSINAVITPGAVSKDKTHSLSAVAENATWRDIGAAIGTFAGGFLIVSTYRNAILWATVIALLVIFLVHIAITQKSFKNLYQWK